MKRCMLFLCAGMILFSSCKKASPPHLEVIPGDAIFVLAFEGKQMAKKGELEKLKDYKFFQKMINEASGNNATAKKTLEEFFQNPKSIGLDFEQFYMYGMNTDKKFYCAGVFKMDKSSVFEEKMKESAKIAADSSFVIEEKGSYKLANLYGETAFVWNEAILFILAGDYQNINFESLFTLPKEKSITSNADFKEFQKQNYDIGCWASYSAFVKLCSNLSPPISMNSIIKDYEGTFMHGYLTFEAGEIKMTGIMTPKAKVDEFYTKHPVINKNFNQKLLEDFPETAYLSYKLSTQWTEVMKYFKEAMGSMKSDDGMQMNVGMMMEALNNPNVKAFTDALGGDMLLDIYGFAQGPLPIPLVGISLSVTSKENFDKALALIPQKQQVDNYYVMEIAMKMPMYFAYKDNRVFLTDDADAITAFTGKGYSKTLKDNKLASNYKKDPLFLYLNLDLDSYPENVKNFIYNEAPGDLKQTLRYLGPYQDITIGSKSNHELYASIKFKDKKQNSLKQLLTNIDTIISSQSK